MDKVLAQMVIDHFSSLKGTSTEDLKFFIERMPKSTEVERLVLKAREVLGAR